MTCHPLQLQCQWKSVSTNVKSHVDRVVTRLDSVNWNQNQITSGLTGEKPYLQLQAAKALEMARNSVILRHLLRLSPSYCSRYSSLIETRASSPIAVSSPPIHTLPCSFSTATINSQFPRSFLKYRTFCSSSGTTYLSVQFLIYFFILVCFFVSLFRWVYSLCINLCFWICSGSIVWALPVFEK